MGQQQLLLLVLSTVIVGLATVAGIQAFDENQQQATQDALVQRGADIASEIKGIAAKPSQLGGLDPASNTKKEFANALGYDSNTGVDAPGAGEGAQCDITSIGGDSDQPDATVKCGTAASVSGGSVGDGSTGQVVTVTMTDGNITTDVGSA